MSIFRLYTNPSILTMQYNNDIDTIHKNQTDLQEVQGVLKTIRNYILIAIAAYGLYFVVAHHFIIDVDNKDIYLLQKSELTLSYTFYNIKDRKIESIMKIDDLRRDGIGDLLVELGMMTEAEKNRLEAKFNAE